MTSPVTPADAAAQTQTPFWKSWLLVWLIMAVLATVRAPIPGVNEPHYLCKARHLWDPTWCARDPFLQSVNAHALYFYTFGSLTQWFSVETTAWIGRIIGWGCLSFSLVSLVRIFDLRLSVASAQVCLSLVIINLVTWSGEWIVGGTEGKVLSYACLLLSLAEYSRGHRLAVAGLAGLTTAWHPVIGLWHTLSLLVVAHWRWLCFWLPADSPVEPAVATTTARGAYWISVLKCVAVWGIASAPGLIPAVFMLGNATPDQAYQADYIQVFGRLSHHLDPARFPLWSTSLLGLLWLGLTVRVFFWPLKHSAARFWTQYVWCTGAITVAGYLIRFAPQMAQQLISAWPASGGWLGLQSLADSERLVPRLLKYYPFRLYNAAFPCYLAWLMLAGFKKLPDAVATPLRNWLAPACLLIFCLFVPSKDANPSRLSPAELRDWIAICSTIKAETPRDALCVVTHRGWGFKWYAERAEFVSRKDCPQDAVGIIAWNERTKLIAAWNRTEARNGYSRLALQNLRKRTEADFFVTIQKATTDVAPWRKNDSFVVYDLRDL